MDMAAKLFLLCAMWLALATGQRPGFAGSRPIGYPEVYNRTTTVAAVLGDRFGEDDVTTQRLPIEANGDRDLIDRLSKLPVDKQPFWFINWQALEANRNNPQTYPQKPNDFVDPLPNTATTNRNPNLNTLNSKTDSVGIPVTNIQSSKSSTESNLPTGSGTSNSANIKNRFSELASSSNTKPKNGLAEIEHTESSATQTTIRQRPAWITKRFKPKNPIID